MEIRAMTLPELEMVLDWAAAEGWNPGLQDAASFYAADPGGFLLGTIDDEPVASIFSIRYGAGFGFIGGYIVRPEYRGHGHGVAMWRAGMARLEGRNVGLDGVPAQQANYARSGFRLAHRNVRYEGRGSEVPAADRVLPLGPQDFAEVLAYDRDFFPMNARNSCAAGCSRRAAWDSACVLPTACCLAMRCCAHAARASRLDRSAPNRLRWPKN